jgi:hypothetical protein
MLLCLLCLNMVGRPHPADLASEGVTTAFKQSVGIYNSLHGSNLEFVAVESATQKVVAGFVFSGIIKVSNGGEIERYSVSVWQRPGGEKHELKEFVKL